MNGLVFVLWVLLAVSPDARDLAQRIRDGDRDAFRTFFDRHHGTLYGFLQSRGVSAADAEDLVQNAFLYVWQHRDRIDPDRSLRAYLFRIGHTRALNHHRDAARVDPDATVDRTPSRDATPDAEALTREQRARIDDAIADLPERRRMVARLCLVNGFTYQEAASVLDVARKTVENHMRLALKDLRDALADLA
jgi:RNA polymerase sigma-70 factor (ECF subfamily)